MERDAAASSGGGSRHAGPVATSPTRSGSSPPTRRAATLAQEKINQAMAPPPPSQEPSPTPSPSPHEQDQNNVVPQDEATRSPGPQAAPLSQHAVKQELQLYEHADAAVEVVADDCTGAGGLPTISKPRGAPVITCRRNKGFCPFKAVVRKVNRKSLWFIETINAGHDHSTEARSPPARATQPSHKMVGQAIVEPRAPLSPRQINHQQTQASLYTSTSHRLQQAHATASAPGQGVAPTPAAATSPASWLPQIATGQGTPSLAASSFDQNDLMYGLCILGKLAKAADAQHEGEQGGQPLPASLSARQASVVPSSGHRAPSMAPFNTLSLKDSQPRREESTSAHWPASSPSSSYSAMQQHRYAEPATYPNNVQPLDSPARQYEQYGSQRYRDEREEDQATFTGQRRRIESLNISSEDGYDTRSSQRRRHDYDEDGWHGRHRSVRDHEDERRDHEDERRYHDGSRRHREDGGAPRHDSLRYHDNEGRHQYHRSHPHADQHRAFDERHHPYGYHAETPLRYQQRDSSRDEHPHTDLRLGRSSSGSYREHGSGYASQPRHSFPSSYPRR